MNAVVAIGGAPLLQAVNAYRALAPSAVWVLGLKTPRDPRDPLIRSLEAFIEPYFATEARAQVAKISAQLAILLLPGRNADPSRTISAVSTNMWKDCRRRANDVATTLALVDMLDRAHATQPVELVLSDDSSALARTAVAWARGRALPSVTLSARVPTRRPRKPSSGKRMTLSRTMYSAMARGRRWLAASHIKHPTR